MIIIVIVAVIAGYLVLQRRAGRKAKAEAGIDGEPAAQPASFRRKAADLFQLVADVFDQRSV